MVKLQRLGCLRSPLIVARDYTKYDEHAVAQIKRTIELGRFRKYGDEFMVLELVNEITSTAEAEVTSSAQRGRSNAVTEYLAQSPDD